MLALIAALDPNRVIGNKNSIPWNIPAERQHFHQLTTSHPIIMGRQTFESLPHPLPNRTNIVVSSVLPLPEGEVEGVGATYLITSTLKSALQKAHRLDDQIFIIGGQQIFEQTIDLADTLYISHLNQSHPGDTFFPEINPKHWQPTTQQEYAEFTFVIYKRI